jgi:hypothetical protein
MHQARDGAGRPWRQQQVHVVVHEHVRVQLACKADEGVGEQVHVAKAIAVVEETRQAVVATLNHMLWHARQVDARESGHGAILAPHGRRLHPPGLRLPVSQLPFDS